MDKHQIALVNARARLMKTRRVVCTGNPDDHTTLASGIRRIFPDATFLCRSTGWDLADESPAANEKLAEVFSTHNTFINASYITHYAQSRLLELCQQSAKHCDVFNIGSTHEYDGIGTVEYRDSKLHLRNLSLSLNSFRFKTHHIILGGINKCTTDEMADWLAIDTICEVIPWIISQPFDVPMIAIDQGKLPW